MVVVEDCVARRFRSSLVAVNECRRGSSAPAPRTRSERLQQGKRTGVAER